MLLTELFIAGGLVHVHLVVKMAIKKTVFTSRWCISWCFCASLAAKVRIVDHFTTGAKTSSKSTPCLCWKPCATRRAFRRGGCHERPGLVLNIHRALIVRFPGDRGTSSYVSFCYRDLYSSSIDAFQRGWDRACSRVISSLIGSIYGSAMQQSKSSSQTCKT
jgi:hypothetical protein